MCRLSLCLMRSTKLLTPHHWKATLTEFCRVLYFIVIWSTCFWKGKESSNASNCMDGEHSRLKAPLIKIIWQFVYRKSRDIRLTRDCREEYYAWGLHQIAKAVSFLNNDCKLVRALPASLMHIPKTANLEFVTFSLSISVYQCFGSRKSSAWCDVVSVDCRCMAMSV